MIMEIEDSDADIEPQEPIVIRASGEQPSQPESTQSSDSTTNCDTKDAEVDEEDGSTCPICLEPWTSGGDHRICALKCGHVFGYKCVVRWLDSQSHKSCPTCKSKVRRTDLRFIYAKKLVAVDNAELESMREQLNSTLNENNRITQEMARYVSREQVLLQEIEQLKKKIYRDGKSSDLRMTLQSPLNRIRLYMDKNIDICSHSECRDCRVFDVCPSRNTLIVSARSNVDLFTGYGLKKISLDSYKTTGYLHLHKDVIRDACFHHVNPWVLTASTDKKFKVIAINDNQATHSVLLDAGVWSCAWDPAHDYRCFVGTQMGSTYVYDLRQASSPVTTLGIEGDYTPVVSIAGVKSGCGLQNDLVLCCKLNTFWAFENQHGGGGYRRHLLPLDGPFLNARYDDKSRHLLVSSRPNTHKNYARHTLCSLERVAHPDTITANVLHTFRGGNTAKYLSRNSCFVPGDLVAGYHESKKAVMLYSINTGDEVCSLPAHNTVLDLKGCETSHGNFLVQLNEKKLEFFKFNTFPT